ncbi:MAG: PIN domain-containing protein [Candidatus Competibacteraceae bacterium]
MDEIEKMLQTLLLNHSSLYQRNNDRDGLIIISPYPYAYRDLQAAGWQVQRILSSKYDRFNSVLKTLLREAPKKILDKFSETEIEIRQAIEQQFSCYETTQESLEKAIEALQAQFSLLKNFYGPPTGDILYVPDTNALLHNPLLEKWKFNGVSSFTIVLTPTILSELDHLKTNDKKKEDVQKKAKNLISQLKEFRRRSNLTEGVTIVKGKSTLLAIATEPNMQNSLPWLDRFNNDDRFLATVIEIMRLRPQSRIFAVSLDVNLQNKAEFACIPFIEPPDEEEN